MTIATDIVTKDKTIKTLDEEDPKQNQDGDSQPTSVDPGTTTWFTDPSASQVLMYLTFALVIPGAVLVFGALKVGDFDKKRMDIAMILFGLVGVVSYIRHSIFHRSDETRLGWKPKNDPDFVNVFLIECGLANNAWGIASIVSVIFDLGLFFQAACIMIPGIYISQVGVMLFYMEITKHPQARGMMAFLKMAAFGGMLLAAGSRAIIVAKSF